MRLIFLVFFVLPALARAEESVTLKVTEFHSWCGGVAPPMNWKRTNPAPRHKLEVFRGAAIPVEDAPIPIATDGAGVAIARLAPGTWCVAEAGRQRRVTSKPPEGATKACWAREVSRCDAVLTVKAGKALVSEVSLVRGCSWNRPCLPPGPMPP